MDADKRKLINLLISIEEGTTRREELRELTDLLGDEEMLGFYIEITSLLSQLRSNEFKIEMYDEAVLENNYKATAFDSDLWNALAKSEKDAPAVMVSDSLPAPAETLIQKVEYSKPVRKINKFTLISAVISVAALFFIFTFSYFTPIEQMKDPVGIITQVQNARFPEGARNLKHGRTVYAGPLNLLEGLLKIELDNGAVVIMKAPVETNFESTDRVYLKRGSLVAKVSREAYGFTVMTPTGSVVDYGTEFGVSVDSTGQTDVEVFKGKVALRNSSNPLIFETSLILTAGQTGKVDISGEITTSSYQRPASTFTRDIPTMWKVSNQKQFWNTVSNWDNGRLPNLLNPAFFQGGDSKWKCVIDSTHTGAARAQAQYVNVGLREYGCLEMTGGELETYEIWVGRQKGGQGIFTLNDGVVSIIEGWGENKIVIGGAWEDEGGGHGVLNFRGGKIQYYSTYGSMLLGWGETAEGILNVEGGELVIPNELCLGVEKEYPDISYNSAGTGYVNIKDGILKAGVLTLRKGIVNIEKGVLKLKGDVRKEIDMLIQDGRIKGYGGSAKVSAVYDEIMNETVIHSE